MKDPSFYVSSFVELAKAGVQERKAIWRSAMAALSRAAADGGPGPLEGLHPDVLVRGVQAAIDDGLVDDLDWLSSQAAGIALYTLASALPVGTEQRELGRRVLARMLVADAETFTAMASIMAQTGGKGLASPGIRARIGLVCELPIAHGVADGPLALALASRREHAREWIATASTRSLPQRRLAAKILERAAREAARRAQLGDSHALRVFVSDTVRTAYNRLLADRESLVWRYVAVARGLCAAWVPELKQQITDSLREGLGPTEYRRASASLAAYAAVKPDDALKIFQSVAKRGLFTREDPASASAFVWGLPRAIEAEPETAAKMIETLLAVAPPEVAEAITELRWEYGPSKVVDKAMRLALELVKTEKTAPAADDDGSGALMHEVIRDLEGAQREDRSLRSLVFEALEAFATEGAPAAHAKVRDVLLSADGAMDALDAVKDDEIAEGRVGSMARRTSMTVLRDFDASLLERQALQDLLKLAKSSDQLHALEDVFDDIRERFAEWAIELESPEVTQKDMTDGKPRHATLRLRRLRALLHLLDGDLGEGLEAVARSSSKSDAADGDVKRARRLRALWLRTVKSLLQHFEGQPPQVLKRTLLATASRALDALVRLGACDVADALLVLAQRIKTTGEFETLAEASMDQDLRHVLGRYARYLRETDGTKPIPRKTSDPPDSQFPPSLMPESALADDRLRAFEELANELAPEASARSESLRTVLMRLHQALFAVSKVGSLRGLASNGDNSPDLLEGVETWVTAIAQMCAGAKARLDPDMSPLSQAPPRILSGAVARVLSGTEDELQENALAQGIDELVAQLPFGIARLVAGILWRLAGLPVDRPSYVELQVQVAEQLPAWLPARRTIGGFYVMRSLGVGGTASVFVVNRAEERHDADAERFALKVPDYNATAARSVSQDEFLKLFREEASALIMLPNHANLARFVTFDLAAKPLPILVMELVEGMTVERMIEARALDVKKTLKALDDVLAGLEAMHSAGLGHLDIKPSNVILRKGEQAVLVDFGLSGRKIRPGCGTGPYGAPEVWGVVPDGYTPTPPAADVYAFGCLAYEMLTGRRLFDAPNEVAQVTAHVTHDGKPPGIEELAKDPDSGLLAEILFSTLRRDPRKRPSAERLRADLRSVTSIVGDAKWPLGLARTG